MIYLASKSPRRKQLLKQLGFEFKVVDIDIDESWDGSEPARDFVCRLALEKARSAKKLIGSSLPILASDTEVVMNEIIFGKPTNREDAISMLMKLSGQTHTVYSAVALIHNEQQVKLNTNQITFIPLTREDCEKYCDTGEPFDKAGAYAIQGRAAAFISRLEGSFSGVMGLPLSATAELLNTLSLSSA